ncbi:MAG: DUF4403 family protein [Chitinophagaceae bacterium]
MTQGKKLFTVFLLFSISFFSVSAQDTIRVQAAKPDTIQTIIPLVNTTPISDIDIPIRIGLKPFYKWANQFIDTLYTSPNYPFDWEQDGCDSRYQYRFVRGPFGFKTYNNMLLVNFSGHYQVKGSTRICSGTSSYSPWTPPCGCGFDGETPRRIDAGFIIKFVVNPDYSIGLFVNRIEPVPVDKCSVCFFGKDITQTVAGQLRTDLDTSIAEMQRKMTTMSLKPYMQLMWDTMQAGYKIPGLGVMNFQPEQIRMSQVILKNDTMYCSLGLSARPSLINNISAGDRKPLPNLSDFSFKNGFRIFTQLHLPYDSLNGIINKQMGGTLIPVGTGLFKRNIRVDSVRLLGGGSRMFVQVYLSKGIRGIVYLEGKPNWDPVTQELRMDSLGFHLKSKQLLIRTASWLLDGAIEKKIKDACKFQLADRLKVMQYMITLKMNQQLYAGIYSKGYVNKLSVENLVTNPTGIDIGAAAAGRLFLDVDGEALLKQFTAK